MQVVRMEVAGRMPALIEVGMAGWLLYIVGADEDDGVPDELVVELVLPFAAEHKLVAGMGQHKHVACVVAEAALGVVVCTHLVELWQLWHHCNGWRNVEGD